MSDTRSSENRASPPVMKSPRSVDIDITGKCNLSCQYCYHFSGSGDVNSDLPMEEWLAFFHELQTCQVLSVTLCGGEPFCRADLVDIIKGIIDNRMRYVILTNGMLIHAKMAEFIASTGRCDAVQVSIDGSNSNVHDMFRGPGSFQRAVSGIKELKAAGVNVLVRATIHKGNVGDLEGVAGLIFDELDLPGFSTNAASYLGRGVIHSDQVGLSAADRISAMKSLEALNKKYGGRISANAGPLAEARSWRKMEKARMRQAKRFSNGGFLTACGCVTNNVAVRADGVIVPCTMLSHLELGRINKDRLADIWQTHSVLRALRQRIQIPLESFDFCEDCPYIPYCTGACPALAYTMTGEIDHPSPDACLRNFLNNGGSLN